MKASIDTCVLLDLLLDQNDDSIRKLRQLRDSHDELVVCGIVYGELSPFFLEQVQDLNLFLSQMDIRVEICRQEDYAYAGRQWHEYRKRRRFVCPTCGKSVQLTCRHCERPISFRQHILSDFIIGAFSQLHCDAILTRDYGYYRTYFPNLKQI